MERILLTSCDEDALAYLIVTDSAAVWRQYPDGTIADCGAEDWQALEDFGLMEEV